MERKLESFIREAERKGIIEDVEYEEVKTSEKKPLNKEPEIIQVEAEIVRKRGPQGFFFANMSFSGNNFNWK